MGSIAILKLPQKHMILAVDVYYKENSATVGGVTFSECSSKKEDAVYKSRVERVEEYVPGEFFKRELPPILHLLEEHALSPEIILIDGFVYLDGFGSPGLGKHLFDALGGKTAVIGVAKSRFATTPDETTVYRGQSRSALFVTSAGISLSDAKAFVESMHGSFRIPYMLKRADRISKETGTLRTL